MSKKIKIGDLVIVITGKEKGKKGTISKMLPKENKVVVSGLNLVKKHVKPSQSVEGGIKSKEMPIHISNVAYFDSNAGAKSKIGFKYDAGSNLKVRFLKESGTLITSNGKL